MWRLQMTCVSNFLNHIVCIWVLCFKTVSLMFQLERRDSNSRCRDCGRQFQALANMSKAPGLGNSRALSKNNYKTTSGRSQGGLSRQSAINAAARLIACLPRFIFLSSYLNNFLSLCLQGTTGHFHLLESSTFSDLCSGSLF